MASEERMRILNMVKEGAISIEDGEKLLASLGEEKGSSITKSKGAGRFLRIRIQSKDEEKVNVNVPISVARWALKMVPDQVKDQLRKGEESIELEDLVDLLQEGMEGQKIVDINDDEGNIVEIYVD